MINSKGQLTSKIFVYMIALIVAGVVLLIGYRLIGDIGEKSNGAAFVRFTTKLSEDIESISYEQGSVKTEKYILPSNFGRVCFVDLDNINDTNYLNGYPIIKDSVESKTKKNVFLLGGDDFETFYIDDLSLNYPYFHCFNSSIVNIRMEGIGDGTLIEPTP